MWFLCSVSLNLTAAVFLVLVLDEELVAGRSLVLVPHKVGNGLIFGLFGRSLVALSTLAKEFLLNKVDG